SHTARRGRPLRLVCLPRAPGRRIRRPHQDLFSVEEVVRHTIEDTPARGSASFAARPCSRP
ncbi:MAG: hypothetical protein M3535_08430, partial [Actinomycetota bacterium]|nr:hypothetical protein [Actinomycetota bacterium]